MDEGLTLNTSPAVPVRFVHDGVEDVYWVTADLDPILYHRINRWYQDYGKLIRDEGIIPNYDELFDMTAAALNIEPEKARSYGAGNCMRVLDFLFGLWIKTGAMMKSSEQPSKSPRRSRARSASAS